jgi:hypothetical protein
MDKTKHHEALSGRPIAAKAIASMRRRTRSMTVTIENVLGGCATAEELHRTVMAQKALAGLDPAHAAYVHTLNQVSVMSERMTALKEMAPFVDIVSKAEDSLMPSGPPISPLTGSYFTCWAFFDACAGPAGETIGTTILEFASACGIDTAMVRLVRLMQESRMGLYIHRGREGESAVLEDIVTGAVCRAIVPAGYGGKKGELWYVRVLPPPIQGRQEHVVFTTPYIVLQPGVHDWRAYFSRALPGTACIDDYERHMKYGPASPTFARPRRFSPEQSCKHWSGRDYQLDERTGRRPSFLECKPAHKGGFPQLSRYCRQHAAPNSRQSDRLRGLNKSADDAIISHSDSGRAPVVPISLVLSSSTHKAHK